MCQAVCWCWGPSRSSQKPPEANKNILVVISVWKEMNRRTEAGRVVRKGLLDGMMPGGGGAHPGGEQTEGFLSGGHSSCKGPEVGMSSVHLNNKMGQMWLHGTRGAMEGGR